MKTPTAFNWTPEMEAIWPREMRPTASGLLAIWEALHGAAVYAAPAPAAIDPDADDGWIKWHGGACPVDPETVVEVRYESHEQGYKLKANRIDWSSYAACEVSHYRVVKPAPDADHAPDAGWITHIPGDPCPVPARLYVKTRLRDGSEDVSQAALLNWGRCGSLSITHWRHLP